MTRQYNPEDKTFTKNKPFPMIRQNVHKDQIIFYDQTKPAGIYYRNFEFGQENSMAESNQNIFN